MPRWYQLRCPEITEELLREWLSSRERERYEGLRALRRRRGWLAGRLAAKTLIRERLAAEGRALCPREIEVRNGPRGEPSAVVAGKPLEVSLSIAHCGDEGLAGIADPEEGLLGVDWERIRPVHPRLAERVLCPEEGEALQALAPEEGEAGRLILAWTLKEAAFKALRPALPEGASLLLRDLRLQELSDSFGLGASVLLVYPHGQGKGEVRLWAAAERLGEGWRAWALLPAS